jgi:hypothetical protein
MLSAKAPTRKITCSLYLFRIILGDAKPPSPTRTGFDLWREFYNESGRNIGPPRIFSEFANRKISYSGWQPGHG